MGLKDILIGDYDWWFLCTPRAPCSGATAPPPFFRKDDQLSIFVAFVMGLQHALAMVGGIITVPLILSGRFYGAFTDDERQYVIAASLIVSGIASLIQVTQIPIPFTNYVIGSGLLSVMGVSFTFLPIGKRVCLSFVGSPKFCAGSFPGCSGQAGVPANQDWRKAHGERSVPLSSLEAEPSVTHGRRQPWITEPGGGKFAPRIYSPSRSCFPDFDN